VVGLFRSRAALQAEILVFEISSMYCGVDRQTGDRQQHRPVHGEFVNPLKKRKCSIDRTISSPIPIPQLFRRIMKSRMKILPLVVRDRFAVVSLQLSITWLWFGHTAAFSLTVDRHLVWGFAPLAPSVAAVFPMFVEHAPLTATLPIPSGFHGISPDSRGRHAVKYFSQSSIHILSHHGVGDQIAGTRKPDRAQMHTLILPL